MAGKPAPKTLILIEPKELVARRSTDSYIVDHPQVAAALRFIGEHSHEDIRVRDVAKHVHISERSLARYFNVALGRSMAEEIVRLRLERATRLLVESHERIKRLASDCGFNSANHFHRVFLQRYGTTPGKYRRRHQTVAAQRGK